MLDFKAFSDKASDTDALGMENSCKGIADFLCRCDTPMTIAINGDWGTGKTSVMNIVKRILAEKYGDDEEYSINHQIIDFNTWEFSIFGENDSLVFELLKAMSNQIISLSEKYDLSSDKKDSAKVSNIALSVLGAVKNVATTVLCDEIGGAKILYSFIEGLNKNNKGGKRKFDADALDRASVSAMSRTSVMKELRESIQTLIGDIMEKIPDDKPDRLFIFVDDLDRLEPKVALSLIEGMKNFASFSNCVFILAVDQNVIERGLKSKYGNEYDEKMSVHFFDKIIQTQFELPTRSYDIEQYLNVLLNNNQQQNIPEQYIAKFCNLLKTFRETNPRSIKRSLNMLLLKNCIDNASDNYERQDDNYELICQQYALRLLFMKNKTGFQLLEEQFDRDEPNKEDTDYLNNTYNSFVGLINTDRENFDEETMYLDSILSLFYGDDLRVDSFSEEKRAATLQLINQLIISRSNDSDQPDSAYYIRKLYNDIKTKAVEGLLENADDSWNRLNAEDVGDIINNEDYFRAKTGSADTDEKFLEIILSPANHVDTNTTRVDLNVNNTEEMKTLIEGYFEDNSNFFYNGHGIPPALQRSEEYMNKYRYYIVYNADHSHHKVSIYIYGNPRYSKLSELLRTTGFLRQ